MTTTRKALATIALAAALTACGGGTGAKTDPYAEWLKNRPADALSLSREDAQTRALLGCQMSEVPAPGTVDAVLQAAYNCR